MGVAAGATVSGATQEPPSLDAVLEGAARLQELVPGAVLVGGSAAAYHAGHRLSHAHDHVVADLAARYDTVLDTLEALDDWSTARLAGGTLILGELGGIETGVRQMVRQRPLEVEEVPLGNRVLRVPTVEEILRIKAWLVVTRNQTAITSMLRPCRTESVPTPPVACSPGWTSSMPR